MFQQQEAFGGDPLSDNGGRMNWSIFTEEKPFCLAIRGFFCLKFFLKNLPRAPTM